MSIKWYPIIDYDLCTECGICTNKCKNGVYDLKKAPMPVVIQPENCIQGCKGCGSICPAGAIVYAGDGDKDCLSSSCGCSDDKGVTQAIKKYSVRKMRPMKS